MKTVSESMSFVCEIFSCYPNDLFRTNKDKSFKLFWYWLLTRLQCTNNTSVIFSCDILTPFLLFGYYLFNASKKFPYLGFQKLKIECIFSLECNFILNSIEM